MLFLLYSRLCFVKRKTGRLFLVSSQFLEITRVLGHVSEEIEERIRYAKWKASDIVKAINEGRQPRPGPPGTEEHDEGHKEMSSEDRHACTLPSMSGQFPPLTSPILPPPSLQSVVLPPINTSPPPAVCGAPSSPPVAPSVSHSSSQSSANPELATNMALAEKYARFGVSAIQFDDLPTAIKNLELSLNILYTLQTK